MQRHILKWGNPFLEQVCTPVTDWAEAARVTKDLWDTLIAVQGLYNFTRGSGLSAPQIGEPYRISAVEFNGSRHTLINPVLTVQSENTVLVTEGCLSFFDWRGRVLRFADVVVEAQDLDRRHFTVQSGGNIDFSSLLQHEVDHLNGLLYPSYMPAGEQLMRREGMPQIP